MMADREKVIKGLQAHADGCGYRSHHCDAMECPYRYGDESCDIEEMCRDALELLKEQPQIVRCKDCKWFEMSRFGERGFCKKVELIRRTTFYCADGERREE